MRSSLVRAGVQPLRPRTEPRLLELEQLQLELQLQFELELEFQLQLQLQQLQFEQLQFQLQRRQLQLLLLRLIAAGGCRCPSRSPDRAWVAAAAGKAAAGK